MGRSHPVVTCARGTGRPRVDRRRGPVSISPTSRLRGWSSRRRRSTCVESSFEPVVGTRVGCRQTTAHARSDLNPALDAAAGTPRWGRAASLTPRAPLPTIAPPHPALESAPFRRDRRHAQLALGIRSGSHLGGRALAWLHERPLRRHALLQPDRHVRCRRLAARRGPPGDGPEPPDRDAVPAPGAGDPEADGAPRPHPIRGPGGRHSRRGQRHPLVPGPPSMSMLEKIHSPADVKGLDRAELQKLAAEMRHVIIQTVARNAGHLAPNLGVVELTLALHRVFDSPTDKIIWDVGHQSYPHKLLTGRYEQFHTLRKAGGIAGYPRRCESPNDPFGTSHGSTSISAALGLAAARDLKGEHHHVVAVIGDGALTGGMAFEGLNNAGELGKPLILVLNDNEMSISPNIGA